MKKIKFTTAGESHGELLMGILEGIPSEIPPLFSDKRIF